jgi:hypothetical protein
MSLSKVRQIALVLRAFAGMGASKTQLIKETKKLATDDNYLQTWYEEVS